jgi:hypothetical protein
MQILRCAQDDWFLAVQPLKNAEMKEEAAPMAQPLLLV